MKRKVLNNMKGSKRAKKIKIIIITVISLILAIAAASVAIVGVSYWQNQKFGETFYSVSSLKVNNKIRIIQISDLHSCTYGQNNRDLVNRVKKLAPDIILLTGDTLSDQSSEGQIVTLCASFAKIAPSYYIYGNNEVQAYYPYLLTRDELDKQFGFNSQNREPQKLLEIKDALDQKLTDVGVTVLKNSTATIMVGDTPVDIYGVLTSNPSAFWPYAGESFNDFLYTNENNFKITAVHEPLIFEEFEPDYWGDIMLAGHTHGGLVKVPMLGPLYTHEGGLLPGRTGHYVYGRYEVVSRPLIVSSGLENQNLLRINNEPEIVIVDVNKF